MGERNGRFNPWPREVHLLADQYLQRITLRGLIYLNGVVKSSGPTMFLFLSHPHSISFHLDNFWNIFSKSYDETELGKTRNWKWHFNGKKKIPSKYSRCKNLATYDSIHNYGLREWDWTETRGLAAPHFTHFGNEIEARLLKNSARNYTLAYLCFMEWPILLG